MKFIRITLLSMFSTTCCQKFLRGKYVYCISSGENNGTKRELPSGALEMCELHQRYFQTNQTLEINLKLVSGEVRKLLSSIITRDLWDIMLSWLVAISIFYIVCFEAVARRRFKQLIKMCGRPTNQTFVKLQPLKIM